MMRILIRNASPTAYVFFSEIRKVLSGYPPFSGAMICFHGKKSKKKKDVLNSHLIWSSMAYSLICFRYTMADGFDPCECVWSHENAMQRLMNLVSESSQGLVVQS